MLAIKATPLTQKSSSNGTLENSSYIEYDYVYTEFGKTTFFMQYVNWGQTVIQYILPFIGLSVLNFLIALQVRFRFRPSRTGTCRIYLDWHAHAQMLDMRIAVQHSTVAWQDELSFPLLVLSSNLKAGSVLSHFYNVG
jgi:hypothetical protein